ncbi:zinc metalloprotease M50B family [Haloferula helveola]|uniref:Zinc metalloprotease M50B family n=1 Tax=Haloferula helveola TaxID=490095 RepID=A0ABN6H7Y6_9BACT|nr:zinc metalloprotease M50B family [Haloferula helveola]
MLRFSLFGIPVNVQPWFWITLALLGGATGIDGREDVLSVALFVLAGFVSVLVHELGHALTGRSFGAPTQITLMAFGGFASFPANAFTRKQDFLVTAAGPAIQILLGLVFFAIYAFVPLPTTAAKMFVFWGMVISIFWAVINLVPVIPLDGGRLVAALLGPSKRVLALQISLVAAIAVALGMFFLMKSFLFPIFLGLMAYQNWQELQQFRR